MRVHLDVFLLFSKILEYSGKSSLGEDSLYTSADEVARGAAKNEDLIPAALYNDCSSQS